MARLDGATPLHPVLQRHAGNKRSARRPSLA
jgi:hypothetical protein